MKKIIFFIFLIFSFNWSELVFSESITEIVRKVSKSLDSTKKCAEKGVISCERDLGTFFSYNLIGKDSKVSSAKNIDAAKFWLFKSINDPFSKFGIGKIILENNKQPIYKLMAGEYFIILSCKEGEVEACSYLSDMYSKIGPKKLLCENKACDKMLGVTRAIIYNINNSADYSSSEKKDFCGKYIIQLAEILIKRHDAESVQILEDAVAQNITWSTTTLAPIYAKGELVPKDLVRAYMLYDLSGTGYADEKAKVAEEMTPAQIQQAKEMSWRWQDEHRSYRPGYRDSDMGVQWQGVRYH